MTDSLRSSSSLALLGEHIFEASRVAVISHYNPDADAYGSSCGLTLALRKCGVDATCFNESGIVERFLFIPGVSQIRNDISSGWPLVVVLDCGDTKRVGDTFQQTVFSHPDVINIDHHISNACFGNAWYVDADASSTCELIYTLLVEVEKVRGKKIIDSDVAAALFAGVSADTGSFRYSSTRPATFDAAKGLLERGAPISTIAESLYESNPLRVKKLQAECLTRAESFFDGRVVRAIFAAHDFTRFDSSPDDTEGFVEELRSIAGVQMAIFIHESDGIWRVSMRSRAGTVDVSQIAVEFGGGGHRNAAGFRWRRSLDELKSALDSATRKLFVH